jgi:hypothetical protein
MASALAPLRSARALSFGPAHFVERRFVDPRSVERRSVERRSVGPRFVGPCIAGSDHFVRLPLGPVMPTTGRRAHTIADCVRWVGSWRRWALTLFGSWALTAVMARVDAHDPRSCALGCVTAKVGAHLCPGRDARNRPGMTGESAPPLWPLTGHLRCRLGSMSDSLYGNSRSVICKPDRRLPRPASTTVTRGLAAWQAPVANTSPPDSLVQRVDRAAADNTPLAESRPEPRPTLRAALAPENREAERPTERLGGGVAGREVEGGVAGPEVDGGVAGREVEGGAPDREAER